MGVFALSVLSGLIVSVDAFFIGLSLGLQKRCRFIHLAAINTLLFALCILGFLVAARIYERIWFDTDLVVGLAFIALGIWCILAYFVSRYLCRTRDVEAGKSKAIVLVGLVMSVEAMIITMGITFIFLPYSSFVIPITVALAHFGYSALSFALARTRQMARFPAVIGHMLSGLALIAYGLMAIFVEIGI